MKSTIRLMPLFPAIFISSVFSLNDDEVKVVQNDTNDNAVKSASTIECGEYSVNDEITIVKEGLNDELKSARTIKSNKSGVNNEVKIVQDDKNDEIETARVTEPGKSIGSDEVGVAQDSANDEFIRARAIKRGKSIVNDEIGISQDTAEDEFMRAQAIKRGKSIVNNEVEIVPIFECVVNKDIKTVETIQRVTMSDNEWLNINLFPPKDFPRTSWARYRTNTIEFALSIGIPLADSDFKDTNYNIEKFTVKFIGETTSKIIYGLWCHDNPMLFLVVHPNGAADVKKRDILVELWSDLLQFPGNFIPDRNINYLYYSTVIL